MLFVQTISEYFINCKIFLCITHLSPIKHAVTRITENLQHIIGVWPEIQQFCWCCSVCNDWRFVQLCVNILCWFRIWKISYLQVFLAQNPGEECKHLCYLGLLNRMYFFLEINRPILAYNLQDQH